MTKEEQAQYIAEKLMENPEFRKAFVGAITDAANEVVKAIKVLQQKPLDVSNMLYDIYMKGVNMSDDYQGLWVRFKDIEAIVNKYAGGDAE